LTSKEDQMSSPRQAISPTEPPVTIVVDEILGERARLQAREMIVRLAQHAPRPVVHARVTLHRLASQAAPAAVARATLDVSGRPVRSHAAGTTVEQALRRLEDRLRRNLENLEERRRARRRRATTH
jgi:hypothetical protein